MPKLLTLLTLIFSFSIIAAEQKTSKETENTAQTEVKTEKNKQASKQTNKQKKQSFESEPTSLLFIPDYLKPEKEPVLDC